MNECPECGTDRILLMSIGDGEFIASCEIGHRIETPEGTVLHARLVSLTEWAVEPEPEEPTYTPSQLRAETRRSRERSLASARSSELGYTAQQLFPFVEAHGYNPRDIQYVGGTMDYLVLDGLSAYRHKLGALEEITVVLAEVKYASYYRRPSRVQRAIIEAMNEGRTRGEYWTATESEDGLSWSPGTRSSGG